MEAERKIIIILRLHEGEDSRAVSDLNNLPPGRLDGVNHFSLNITHQLSGTLQCVVAVDVTAETDSSQDEVLSRPGHLADWTGGNGAEVAEQEAAGLVVQHAVVVGKIHRLTGAPVRVSQWLTWDQAGSSRAQIRLVVEVVVA